MDDFPVLNEVNFKTSSNPVINKQEEKAFDPRLHSIGRPLQRMLFGEACSIK